jgi:hypothetical protein
MRNLEDHMETHAHITDIQRLFIVRTWSTLRDIGLCFAEGSWNYSGLGAISTNDSAAKMRHGDAPGSQYSRILREVLGLPSHSSCL